jgi:hypothetical protein
MGRENGRESSGRIWSFLSRARNLLERGRTNGDQSRHFFHSFPRPKPYESVNETIDRGLEILKFMKQVGLILAPEVVRWDVSGISPSAPEVNLLQRRASFTELATSELARHSETFGPISLAFKITKLREIGANPVVYVPQGITASPHSLIPTFAVNGIYHTKFVLSQLQELKALSDPSQLSAQLGLPVDPSCEAVLTNPHPDGKSKDEYRVRITEIEKVLRYVGYRNIPFDHSVAIIDYFLSLFYPTDNVFRNDELGYYRQREWRLVASTIGILGRPLTRALSLTEIAEVERIDHDFWSRELTVGSKINRRSELALVFEPEQNWNFFDIVEEVLVPECAVKKVKAIVGDGVAVHALPRGY